MLTSTPGQPSQHDEAPLNATEEQVFNLLSSGLNAAMVASTLSISESLVSQMLSREDFRERVSAARLSRSKGLIARDDKLEMTEAKALERLSLLLPMVTKPAEAAKIYQVLNNAKRATAPIPPSSSSNSATVVLNLPAKASVSFTLTHDTQQVVEVDGRSMAALPAKNLKDMMSQRSLDRQAQQRLLGLVKSGDIGVQDIG